MSKYNIGLKMLLLEGMSEPEFYGVRTKHLRQNPLLHFWQGGKKLLPWVDKNPFKSGQNPLQGRTKPPSRADKTRFTGWTKPPAVVECFLYCYLK